MKTFDENQKGKQNALDNPYAVYEVRIWAPVEAKIRISDWSTLVSELAVDLWIC